MDIYVNVGLDGQPCESYWTKQQADEDRVKGERLVVIPLPLLSELVLRYYAHRKLPVPNIINAALFMNSEVGELNDALVHQMGQWVRNNDRERNIEDEMGDVLMMLTMVGYCLGKDPIDCMLKKFVKKGFPTSE